MIKIDAVEVTGFEQAIRGMRNPMNSRDRSDTVRYDVNDQNEFGLFIGKKDEGLMTTLAKAGSVHAKYRRMIVVYADITAPLYWWKEFDTYKVGTVSNSCSTMHKIHAKKFVIEDFSHEHLTFVDFAREFHDDIHMYENSIGCVEYVIETLNYYRTRFIETGDKKYWWNMIQLLPSSYNQMRTIMMNYEVLANIFKNRHNHKLDEWLSFCDWIDTLPYSEIITLKEKE